MFKWSRDVLLCCTDPPRELKSLDQRESELSRCGDWAYSASWSTRNLHKKPRVGTSGEGYINKNIPSDATRVLNAYKKNSDPSGTTHILCKCTIPVHIYTEIMHFYNICVVPWWIVFNYAFNILVVSDGMFNICIYYTRCTWWNVSVNLGGLQANLKGGSAPPGTKIAILFSLLHWCQV